MRKDIERMGIQTGDTLLVSGTSLLAETIQQFEDCSYNHAGMFLYLNGILYVCEASAKGIVITLFSEYEKREGVGLLIMRPKFDMPSEGSIIDFCLPYVGHSQYGFFNLLVAQALRFATKKKIWIGPKKDPMTHRFICGEMVCFIYNHFNTSVFDNWNELSPEDIFNSGLFDKYVFK